jgi:hypothetical protein
MNALSLKSFESHLAMLLRDQPRGMTAELSDFAVAYWNGHEVVYCFLRDDGCGRIEEEFQLADYVWEEWMVAFTAWCANPTFTNRAEVLDWIKDSPPLDSVG